MKQIQNLDINVVSQKQKDQTISEANYGLLNSPKKRDTILNAFRMLSRLADLY